MNIHDLRQAQADFTKRIDDILDGRKELYNKRTTFTKHFNTNKIAKIGIEFLKLNFPKFFIPKEPHKNIYVKVSNKICGK